VHCPNGSPRLVVGITFQTSFRTQAIGLSCNISLPCTQVSLLVKYVVIINVLIRHIKSSSEKITFDYYDELLEKFDSAVILLQMLLVNS
jgi:hypothetical protein